MERITIKHLRALAETLNKVTGSPVEPWSKSDGKIRANIGNYHISRAYGGFCVHRMESSDGGVDTPISYGHIPARDLYERMRAYISGFEACQRSCREAEKIA